MVMVKSPAVLVANTLANLKVDSVTGSKADHATIKCD